jgi:Bacterial PH domain
VLIASSRVWGPGDYIRRVGHGAGEITDKRLLLVDKQGLTGSKVEYMSLPYRSITRFCVETAGTFDADSELKIWVSGSPEPLLKQFKKGSSILEIQKVLATYVLK